MAAPSPVKKALPCALRLLPSITNNPLAAKPQRAIRACTRAFSDSSASGSNLLNSGMMTVGTMMCMSSVNATQAPHAHTHHRGPAACMIHRISAASGSPMMAPISTPFARSARYSFQVTRLKPKRCSMRKVPYRSNGRSARPFTIVKDTSSASWYAMAPKRGCTAASATCT